MKHGFPSPGRMVDIGGGARLHVYEAGSHAAPTVILEAGICATSLNWRPLQTALSQFARVVAYDRAGLGWSDPAASPRTPAQLSLELRSLLEAAKIEPPYVLVGHSFGAFIVRQFADLFSDDTAGLVLIDPLRAEEWLPLTPEKAHLLATGLRLARRGHALARLGIIRAAIALYVRGLKSLPQAMGSAAAGKGTRVFAKVSEQVKKLPRELWAVIASHWADPKFFRTVTAYLRSLPESAREIAALPRLQGIPVSVITGLQNTPVAISAFASVAPDLNMVYAEKSGHWIHLDEPELVLSVILEMLTNVRTGCSVQAKTEESAR